MCSYIIKCVTDRRVCDRSIYSTVIDSPLVCGPVLTDFKLEDVIRCHVTAVDRLCSCECDITVRFVCVDEFRDSILTIILDCSSHRSVAVIYDCYYCSVLCCVICDSSKCVVTSWHDFLDRVLICTGLGVCDRIECYASICSIFLCLDRRCSTLLIKLEAELISLKCSAVQSLLCLKCL